MKYSIPEIQTWLEETVKSHPQLELDQLKLALQLTNPLPIDEKIGLATAEHLLSLSPDTHTIIAALVYPAFENKNLTLETITQKLGANIAKLIHGVQRMDAISSIFQTHQSIDKQRQADNLRKMSLAIVDDVRVVLIKLAERLAVLKSLRGAPDEEKQTVAKAVMSIYAPLANRLGIGQMKWQLEDWSFRYLHPDEYKTISKALKMRRADRETYIEQMIAHISALCQNAHVDRISISGRAKHIFSIHKKIQRKSVEFSEIYDTSAIRILVPSIKDCYTVLSLVHSQWPQVEKEFDDYIAKPKPNGYRSIHTVINGPQAINVEIQIRTYKMHEEAELGIAAHWKYKEGRHPSPIQTQASVYEEKIQRLRSIMEWQKELTGKNQDTSENELLYHKIFEDRIYVFSPQGDILDLESGSTPLDFAYHVHTELGHRCRGAKVNNNLVSLTHHLKTGDVVTIMTMQDAHPSRDWLNPELGYLKTNHARSKVRIWFKKQYQQEDLAIGQMIWEKAARREGLSQVNLDKIAKQHHFKNEQECLIALGSGQINVATLISRIKMASTDSEKKTLPELPLKKPASTAARVIDSGLTIEGVGNLLTQLARCCKPIPGDLITGFITKGRGVTIHQHECKNIAILAKRYPERIQTVHWGTTHLEMYPVSLWIEAEDRPGLVRDLSAVLANEHLSLLSINTRVNKLENKASIYLTIEIKSVIPLPKIISLLRQVNGVTEARRV